MLSLNSVSCPKKSRQVLAVRVLYFWLIEDWVDTPLLLHHFDELEEHQAFGDSTLGCNEAIEQHNERSDRARGAARRGALPLRM